MRNFSLATSSFSPFTKLKFVVITGFNTDIEYKGITYHVQTEDKGKDSPMILSLVYNRGTILASKRSPYEDLLIDFDEKILAERLSKQHKLICAAIKAGRIEDLKRMTIKDSASKKKVLVAQKEIKHEEIIRDTNSSTVVIVKEQVVAKNIEKQEVAKTLSFENIPNPDILTEKTEKIEPPKELELPQKTSESEKVGLNEKVELKADLEIEEKVWDIPIDVIEEFIIEDVQVIEEPIMPLEAVAVITDFAKNDSISEDELRVELLNEKDFKGGERTTLNILVTRGKHEKSVINADVLIKVLGSSFRPLIFHAKTDSNGVAIVHLQFPHFKTGRAALLIKVTNRSDEVEVRRIIQQG
jgi:hypothetical protein